MTDYYTSGDWTWSQSNQKADLSLYSDYFNPSNGGSCVVMTVADRELQWVDLDCSALEFQDKQVGSVCQCKGGDCQPSATTTTPALTCRAGWIDAGNLGCIKFFR